ncbi:uncharacterized protein LOC144449371 [Glandiceps talaboti]
MYQVNNLLTTTNWDGFHDYETGLFGYTWTVGKEPCLDDIHPHKDPHSHLFDESEWTHIGLAYPLSVPFLPDGQYHVSVRALNKVKFGGPMATTVCHSTPYTIDNTAPLVNEVFNVHYDDADCMISAEYNVSDDLSNIREIDFGLGRSTRDAYIMDWERESNLSHIEVQFCIPDGIPAWVKIRAINNVDLRTIGHAPSPIIVDTSPPIPGEVFDGTVHDHDIDYQSYGDEVCVSWHGFYDQESGIANYEWFVGTAPGENDTVPLVELSHSEYRACSNDVSLVHNQTYYSTIIAYNAGHKNLYTSVTTDGVLYDATPPVEGWIKDGLDPTKDMVYSSERATVSANWDGFYDPESSMKEYTVTVWRKHADTGNYTYPTRVIHNPQTVTPYSNSIDWHHFHLHHGDFVYVEVEGINNALSGTDISSDGYTVDLTEPTLYYLGDGNVPGQNSRYTASTNQLAANWDFEDSESGVDHYKLSIYETFGGTRRKIYPVDEDFESLAGTLFTWTSPVSLSLETGGHYSVRIAATNGAGLTNVQDTDGVIVDPSPPIMRVLAVGILTPGSEELFDGFVVDSDKEGIKAYWKATDFESGIDAYFVAVGTAIGSTDILDFTDMGTSAGGYIGNLDLSLFEETSAGPVYYVSVKAMNGAGTYSNVKVSSPIKIVSGDKVGFVIDGPNDDDDEDSYSTMDVDYQIESGTVTAQFTGFESEQHGIVHYEWAVGTEPELDDVQPYINAGILVSDEQDIKGDGLHGSGKAQSLLPLESGIQYYTTVRALTGAGNVLEASSDGFTVDITPPSIHIETIGVIADNDTTVLNTETDHYQKSLDSLIASWTILEEESEVTYTEFCYGSYPRAADIFNCTEMTLQDNVPNALVQPSGNYPNILTLKSINKVGLHETVTSRSITVDTTPPVAGNITCPRYSRSVDYITCTWTDYTDKESGIAYYEFAVGMSEGDDSVFPFTQVDSSVNGYTAKGFEGGALQPRSYYVTVSATNNVGETTRAYSSEIFVDETVPITGKVFELSGVDLVDVDNANQNGLNLNECLTTADCEIVDAVCQTSVDRVHVAWEPFTDPDSPIVRYQLAVGTNPGGTQLQNFYDVDTNNGLIAVITNIDLYNVREAYVSVRGFNAAGLYSTATSDGVYISRVSAGLPSIGNSYVWEGNEDKDINYQDNNEELSGQWNFDGDPCPIVKYEWSILRFDGLIVQPMAEVPDGMTRGVNDELDMRDGESYYLVVRATNKLGYSYSLRSDGITIQKEPLLPGHVRDGDIAGYDINYQKSITSLSGNWDIFGINRQKYMNEESLGIGSHQIIDHYEVAAGTDRRYPYTRDDVHPFVNVGLNTSHTFYDLHLVPRKLTYYITVTAYSVSTATAEITSNGLMVGYGGSVVSAGDVKVSRYITSATSMTISWTNFAFGMPVLFYQVGIGESHTYSKIPSCLELQHFNDDGEAGHKLEYAYLFDKYPLTNVGKDTMLEVTGLNLVDKETYTVTVVATDQSAQCSLATSNVTVDLTPPIEGKLSIGAFDDEDITYTHREDMLSVSWNGYHDDESGIKGYILSIYDGLFCGNVDEPVVLQDDIEVLANDTDYTFVDLRLQPDHPYFVHLVCINAAGLTTTTKSKAILVDLTDPVEGVIKDGQTFTNDIEYQSVTSKLEGVFLHLPNPRGTSCPRRQILFQEPSSDNAWTSISSEGVWDVSEKSVMFRPQQLTFDDNDILSLNMIRDVKRERIYSAAYSNRNPDVREGGKYEVEILAAAGGMPAVTSVVFWGGPEGVVGDFDAPVKEKDWGAEDRVYNECELCCKANDDVGTYDTCRCNCTEYFLLPTVPVTTTATTLRQHLTLPSTTSPSQWKVIKDSDPAETFSGNDSLKLISYQSMGFQLHPGVEVEDHIKNYAVLWFRLKDSPESVKYDIAELNFNPSEAWHSYTFNVVPEKGELSIELSVDGVAKMYMSGLAVFDADVKFILSAWNRGERVPSFKNVFDAPKAVAKFRNLRFPPTSDALCRFGDPFRNGDHGIVAFYAGVGSEKLADDVVPFKEITRPCLACITPCDQLNCDNSCHMNDVKAYHVELDGLELSPNRSVIKNGQEEIVPAVYHLTVKAVAGSGRHVVASSDGVYVDDTPPKFDYLYHLDLEYSEDEPVEYQGGNTTIAIKFSAFDIGSQVREYRWAIGTQPSLTDIQDFVSVGLETFLINDNLLGVIEDRQTYYVTVEAINNAGLITKVTTSGITIISTAPDTSQSNTTTECGDTKQVDGVTLCGDQSSVGMSWTRIDEDSVDGYFFKIGSSEDSQDIFPELRVGYNMSGNVLIKDGYVYIGDEPLVNISGVRQIAEGQAGTAGHEHKVYQNRFKMEPGRTLYSELIACNRGHKCDKVTTTKATIIREQDVLQSQVNDSEVVILLKDSDGGSNGNSDWFVKIETDEDSEVVITKRQIEDEQDEKLTLLAGLLSGSDLEEDYVSDASPHFKPYIVNPETTRDKTDRFLHQRIKDIIGPTFYLTSIGEKPLSGPVYVTLHFNTTLFNDSNVERFPTIMYWHTAFQEWRDASHTCKSNFGEYLINQNEDVISVKVCSTNNQEGSEHRSKRGTDSNYFEGPTEFTFAGIGGFTNSPPVITSTSNLWIYEDGGTLQFQVTAFDDDGDPIIFKLNETSSSPRIGIATLSTNGMLTYRPCLDCFGTDFIHFIAIEDRSDEFDTLSTMAMIEIDVREENDNPDIFLAVDNVIADVDNKLIISVEERNANISEYTGFKAIVGAWDPDTYDQLTLIFDLPKHGRVVVGVQHTEVSFLYTDCTTQTNVTDDHLSPSSPETSTVVFPCELTIPHEEDRLSWVFSTITYFPAEGYFGEDSFQINALDQDGFHSEVLTVHVHVLVNPCMNGARCIGPKSDPDCTSIQRSYGFDAYQCQCPPGYIGEYCETYYNQCDNNPCEFNYTCIDMVEVFVCHCENLDWPCGEKPEAFPIALATSVCVGTILFVIIVIIIWRRTRSAKKEQKVHPETDIKNVYEMDVKDDIEMENDEGVEDKVDVTLPEDEGGLVSGFDVRHLLMPGTPDLDEDIVNEEPKDQQPEKANETKAAEADDETEVSKVVFSSPTRFGFVDGPYMPKYAWGKEKDKKKGKQSTAEYADLEDEDETEA